MIKPNVAGTAIITPSTEEVATARSTSWPEAFNSGTDKVPPPIPIRDEKKPIREASAFCTPAEMRAVPASPPFLLVTMRTAMVSAKVAKMIFRPAGAIKRAAMAPESAPTAINAPQLFSTSTSTTPRLKCARADCVPVKQIIASEVPTAIWICR